MTIVGLQIKSRYREYESLLSQTSPTYPLEQRLENKGFRYAEAQFSWIFD